MNDFGSKAIRYIILTFLLGFAATNRANITGPEGVPARKQGPGLVIQQCNRQTLKRNEDMDSVKKYRCLVAEGTPLPREWARGGHIGGVIDGHVFVAGGTHWNKDKTAKSWLKSSAVFRDGQWVKGPDLPTPLAYPMYGCDDKGVYVAGGTSDGKLFTKEAYVLSSLENEGGLERLASLPEAISYGAGVVVDGKFYVACGSSGSQNTNRMWVLDLNKPGSHWDECQPVPGRKRIFPALVANGKYLYLLGGLAESSPLTPLNDMYRYNTEDDKWIRLKDLPVKGYAWVSQPVDDNHLLITGRADGKIHKGIWLIDLQDLSMHETGDLIIPSTTSPLINVADKTYWLVGGEPDSNKNRTEKVSVIRVKSMKDR